MTYAYTTAREMWTDAACRDHPHPDWWFPPAGHGGLNERDVRHAITICRGCILREPCLNHALEHNEPGIWGGLTERQRHELTHGRPVAPLDACPDCGAGVSGPGRRCNACAAQARTQRREAS